MFDYKKYFDIYCHENRLALHLSFEMPSGYEAANGTFDVASKTIFINERLLDKSSDYKKAFFLFHELRHASQYLSLNQFSDAIKRSSQYIIMYDGTCYKLVNGDYLKCKLTGDETYLTNLYLGQPHEVDANRFAYEQTRKLYGDSDELKELFHFWMPRQAVPDKIYDDVFSFIDKLTKTASSEYEVKNDE